MIAVPPEFAIMSEPPDLKPLPILNSEDLLPPVSRWATVGGLFLVGMLGIAGILSAIVKYDVTVKAAGRVHSPVHIVQSDRQGIVSSIEVAENQAVSAGDILMYLETQDSPQIRALTTQQQQHKTALQGYQQQLNAANAQIESLRQQIFKLAGRTLTGTEQDAVYSVAVALEKLESTSPVTAGQLQTQWLAALKQQDELQRQVQTESAALAAISAQLDSGGIRTPTTGTIRQLNLQGSGQLVQVGDRLAEIVSTDSLSIQAGVPVRDIGKVQLGQTVQLRVSACPYTEYGLLGGTVRAIAPDIATPANNSAGVAPYYEVTIQPQNHALGHGDRQCALKPGMDVRADIITQRETVLRSLLEKARLVVGN
ncbi:MAG TPA: HlyD family efflux transporter periplasmic adaptor subunit [Oscillatoriales cyanobacterium M59_W2019_021]|nr:HlyD family efflux transporter periplasmic adaptor subunit [Oscillatoriales cyanobacterium M4454_W2019_049]HIK52255.1 HlyD family efflux transporter periplasmic adaptor subunit [Oscillatoriales cyanobacterium M59_W2019_021]